MKKDSNLIRIVDSEYRCKNEKQQFFASYSHLSAIKKSPESAKEFTASTNQKFYETFFD